MTTHALSALAISNWQESAVESPKGGAALAQATADAVFTGALDGGGRSTPSGRQGGQNRVSPGLAKATTDLAGQVFVVADIDTNSLIVTTAAKYEQRVHKIIEELDRPVQQVLIKVLVGHAGLGDRRPARPARQGRVQVVRRRARRRGDPGLRAELTGDLR